MELFSISYQTAIVHKKIIELLVYPPQDEVRQKQSVTLVVSRVKGALSTCNYCFEDLGIVHRCHFCDFVAILSNLCLAMDFFIGSILNNLVTFQQL